MPLTLEPKGFEEILAAVFADTEAPLQSIRTCAALLAALIPDSSVWIWYAGSGNAVCVAGVASDPVAAAALASGLLTGTAVELDVPPGMGFSVATGMLLESAGALLVLSHAPLSADQHQALGAAAFWLATAVRVAASTPPERRAPVGNVVHDCLSELSIISSATECLERYGPRWDEEKKQRFLGKILASVGKIAEMLQR